MSLLSWNCRGLEHLHTIQELHYWVKEKKPTLVFLMETKLRNNRMQVVRNKLKFSGMLTVESVGKSGGLALLWKNLAVVDIINYYVRHICASVALTGFEDQWKFMSYYGNPYSGARVESLSILRHLQTYSPSD